MWLTRLFKRKRKEERKMKFFGSIHGPAQPVIPPTVDLQEFKSKLNENLKGAQTAAAKAVKRLTTSAGIREDDVISEAERVRAGAPARPGDLLGDLVHRAIIDKRKRRKHGRDPS